MFDLSLSKEEFGKLIKYYEKTSLSKLNPSFFKNVVEVTTIVNNNLYQGHAYERQLEHNQDYLPFIHYQDLNQIYGHYATHPTRYLEIAELRKQQSSQDGDEAHLNQVAPADTPSQQPKDILNTLISVKPNSIALSKVYRSNDNTHFIWKGTQPLICSTNFFALQVQPAVQDQLDITYVSAYLGSEAYNLMVERNFKGLIPYINKRDIDDFLIPVPALEIQQQIGKVFYTWHEYIRVLQSELEQRHNTKLQYLDYLIRDISNKHVALKDGKVHIFTKTQHSVGQKYKIADIATITLGKIKNKPATNQKHSTATSYPIYSATNDTNDLAGYSYDEDPHRAGSISYTMAGWRAGTFTYRDHPYHATRMCGVIEITRPDLVDARFLTQYLNYICNTKGNTIGRFYENTRSFGAGVLLNLEIELPNIEVQKVLGRLFQAQLDLIQALEEEIKLRKQQLGYFLNLFFPFDELVSLRNQLKRESSSLLTKDRTSKSAASETRTEATTVTSERTAAELTSAMTASPQATTADENATSTRTKNANQASEVKVEVQATTEETAQAPATATATPAQAISTSASLPHTPAAGQPSETSTAFLGTTREFTTASHVPQEPAPQASAAPQTTTQTPAASSAFDMDLILKAVQEQMTRIITTETGEAQIQKLKDLNEVVASVTDNILKLQQLSQATSGTPTEASPATSKAEANAPEPDPTDTNTDTTVSK